MLLIPNQNMQNRFIVNETRRGATTAETLSARTLCPSRGQLARDRSCAADGSAKASSEPPILGFLGSFLGFNLSYHDEETGSFTIDPYYGKLK